MTEALKLGGEPEAGPRIRRLNRLPIIVAIVLVVAFFAIIIYGLSSRGFRFGAGDELTTTPGSRPASRFGDELTQGVPDGIIGEPAPVVLQPTPVLPDEEPAEPAGAKENPIVIAPGGRLEAEALRRVPIYTLESYIRSRGRSERKIRGLMSDVAGSE